MAIQKTAGGSRVASCSRCPIARHAVRALAAGQVMALG